MRSGAPPDAATNVAIVAWLQARGATDARVGDDGVIEFSTRPLSAALTAAVRDLLLGVGLAVTPHTLPHTLAPFPE